VVHALIQGFGDSVEESIHNFINFIKHFFCCTSREAYKGLQQTQRVLLQIIHGGALAGWLVTGLLAGRMALQEDGGAQSSADFIW
jgi:hypothetical protein